MTDRAPTTKSTAAAELFALMAMSFGSGGILMLAVDFFAKGDGKAWIDLGLVIWMLIAALFLARRLFHQIT